MIRLWRFPLSLGIAIETAGGAMIALINFNITFPIKILNFLHLLLQTNPVYLYKYAKESVLAPRRTTYSSCMYLSCISGCPSSWSYLWYLLLTILWTSLLRTRRLGPETPTASLSLTTTWRFISAKRTLISWLKKLRNRAAKKKKHFNLQCNRYKYIIYLFLFIF